MSLLRISELAAESGVPTSTLRYYERIGLVEPQGRSDSGYRLYAESTVDRLAFIGRAKRLGMNLDDVATLTEAWFTGECEPLQEQLRGFIRGRIGELQRQIADESAFERQLERILTRLDTAEPLPDRCAPDCGCDVDPGEMFAGTARDERGDDSVAIVCSLSEQDRRRRISDWQQLVVRARSGERIENGVRFVFAAAASVTTDLARLCAAEVECCSFLEFTLELTACAIVLTIAGPDASAGAFAELIDVAPLEDLAIRS